LQPPWAVEAEAPDALKEDGFKAAQFGRDGINQLEIGAGGKVLGDGVEKKSGSFCCAGEFPAVVVAGWLPDVEVAGSAPVHAAEDAGGGADEAEFHFRTIAQSIRQPFQDGEPFVAAESGGGLIHCWSNALIGIKSNRPGHC
jgi:hypothetical protein